MQDSLFDDFFYSISSDPRISVTHIGLFMCLLQYWRQCNFAKPLPGNTNAIKELAKISSNTTYYKCINDLAAFGYIRYVPSHKPKGYSKIFFKEMINSSVDKKSELGNDKRSDCYDRRSGKIQV